MNTLLKNMLRRFFYFSKLLLKTIIMFIIIVAVATTLLIFNSGDSDFQYTLDDKIVNDITELNPIRVARIVRPETTAEVAQLIQQSTGPISIGGGRFSQGGQIAYPDSLHLDMRSFNKVIKLDPANKTITVQPGITWRQIQQTIDPYNLSVKIMQTYANFTVGGSLSVNVHGRYIGEGPLIKSVQSIKVILADGSINTLSPEQNSELFYGVIGGYGGLGVIVEATLSLADNVKVERVTTPMLISEYKEHFLNNITHNKNVIFHNADIYPPNYENVLDVSWYITDKDLTIDDRLIPADEEYSWQPTIAEFVADYDWGKWAREHIIDPFYYSQERIVWRNWEASYDVNELEPDDRDETTYGLREYFIPTENFDSFVPKMREIFQRHEANILNISIRHAEVDPGSLLAWARKEVFAFVVYYRQGTSIEAKEKVKQWSQEIIDAVIDAGGAYYLPYQIHATEKQFHAAYPNAKKFFALKVRVDPDNRFKNKLWEKYYPGNQTPLKTSAANIKEYYRREEQTFLTIPEWYLVFNPLEYANYLQGDNNPSDFPFFASINEYWTLYDRVTAITNDIYPDNAEYITTLQVIGVSTTVEYMLKGLYETTIGRFTYWIANQQITDEDKIIQQAHRAYSDLIFDKAWYEFDFSNWVAKIWQETDFFGANFIRKLERKLVFTLEFGFKSFYAKLIEFGAKAAFDSTEGLIYLTVNTAEVNNDIAFGNVNTLEEDKQRAIISVPRWGDFTNTLPKLAAAGYMFENISGNQKIVVSTITPSGDENTSNLATLLFTSQLVSDPSLQRNILLVKTSNLRELLIEAKQNNVKIEHIYDY